MPLLMKDHKGERVKDNLNIHRDAYFAKNDLEDYNAPNLLNLPDKSANVLLYGIAETLSMSKHRARYRKNIAKFISCYCLLC